MDARAEWAALYVAEAAAIRAALRGVAVGVEHIGSTAVAGLAGKPIVDIQVGVVGPPEPRLVEGALARLGYEGLGEAGVRGSHAAGVFAVQGGICWGAGAAGAGLGCEVARELRGLIDGGRS